MITMTISEHQVWSDLPISPGSVLEEEIEARAITQKELARRMGRPPQVVNEIIKPRNPSPRKPRSNSKKCWGCRPRCGSTWSQSTV